jgi:hypothetical protein
VAVVPSCSTLRQRMDTHAASWFELAQAFNLFSAVTQSPSAETWSTAEALAARFV